MYCSWIGKICIFVTMINSQDKILQKTERMIYFHIMFMSASSIKRKSTLLLESNGVLEGSGRMLLDDLVGGEDGCTEL